MSNPQNIVTVRADVVLTVSLPIVQWAKLYHEHDADGIMQNPIELARLVAEMGHLSYQQEMGGNVLRFAREVTPNTYDAIITPKSILTMRS